MILHRRAPLLFVLFALPALFSLAGCSSLHAISIIPGAGSAVLTAVGQTEQFTAIGQSQTGNAPTTTNNITGSVTWSVSNPNVATISATGLATAVGAGYTQVLAESGGITATSDLTVTFASSSSGSGSGSGGSSGSGSAITGITVIPGTQAVASPGQTAQFLAIGTSSSGTTLNLTNLVSWTSSSTQIATVGAGTGFATAVGQGTSTIAALYSTSGSVVTGTATFTVSGGTTEKYTSVTITPGSQSLSASGQTSQLIALGTSGSSGLESNVSSSPQITWTSSIPSIASVSASGLVTGLSAGSTNITAVLTNTDSTVVSATAAITVAVTPAPEPLLSLTIIPGSITVDNLLGTGQFLAIGTYATAPYVRDLTNSPNLIWISDAPSIFTVDTNSGGNAGATAGLVTAYGSGSGTIIAEATNPLDGTIQTATATFNCPLALPNPLGDPPTPGSCIPSTEAPSLLSTLTIYNEGLNTTNWEITAPSGTGTPNVIHCGPGWALNGGTGGSVCAATYPVGTTVTLTAPDTGANFGGWSYNCAAQGTVTAAGPNTCTITLTVDDTVGAIFN